MSNGNNADKRITVSFNLPEKLYDQLIHRMPAYGERTFFFRTVVEKLLAGELQVEVNKKF